MLMNEVIFFKRKDALPNQASFQGWSLLVHLEAILELNTPKLQER